MNEFQLILIAYLHNLVEWTRTHFFKKKVQEYQSPIKYFKKGDPVEAPDGTKGYVWRRYVKVKTGQPVGCAVMWDGTYQGNKITPFVPAEDKSPEFNPIIRKSN